MKRLATLFLIAALLVCAISALAEQPSLEMAARSVVPEDAELLYTGKDDGLVEYLFRAPDGTGYQVDVHPETLEVWKLEIRLTGTAIPREEGSLTADEAKELVLSTVKEGRIVEFEKDYDDGRLEYEGTIVYEEMEYEFEIDGYSGAIRSWDVESVYD